MDEGSGKKREWKQRAVGGPGGRLERDERGNRVWVRTRATDSVEVSDLTLECVGAHPAADRSGLGTRRSSYFEYSAHSGAVEKPKPRDLRALSRWIETQKILGAGPATAAPAGTRRRG